MYAGRCKHGKILAGTVGPNTDVPFSKDTTGYHAKAYIDFALFVIEALDLGYTITKENSVTLESCEECLNEKGLKPCVIREMKMDDGENKTVKVRQMGGGYCDVLESIMIASDEYYAQRKKIT
jgi:hypothetical protein